MASTVTTSPIARIDWKKYTKEKFDDEFVKTNTPCLISGALESWPAIQKWQDPNYLIGKIGKDEKFLVELVNKKYLPYIFDEKRRFVDSRIMTTFGNFVEHCLSHTEKVDGDLWYCSQQHYPELALDHPVPDIMLNAKLLTTPYAWIGQVGSGPGLHIDMADNVLCQIRGDKKVWLIPPEDTHFCYPRLGGQTNFSDIPDVTDQAAIEAKFPLFKQARKFEVILKPGDALFIPANWWHEIWALSPFCISVNFFFDTAGAEPMGISLDEYDLLEQLVLEKFKRACPKFRDHFLRYFEHQNWKLNQESTKCDTKTNVCT